MPFTSYGRPSGGPSTPVGPPDATACRRTWVGLLAVAAGLVAVTWLLPGPAATLHLLFDSGPSAVGGAVADTAMLSVAALSVWLLLGWAAVVAGAAVVGRLPGVIGATGRAALSATAPVAVRNALLTVVGASVVTGLAGCALPAAGTAPDITGVSASAGAALSAAALDAVPRPGSADGTAGAPQLRAERLIGIATASISDRIAVEGSAVRAAGSAPVGAAPLDSGPSGSAAAGVAPGTIGAGGGATSGIATGTGRPAPSLDWPATAAGISGPAATTAAAPATSAPGSPGSAAGAPRATVPDVSIDWPGPPARGASSAEHSVVVLRGDSLWAIAARSLPDGTDDATIDRTWRAWYAANTSVIGDNPDQLLPGQILQPPTATPGTGTH